MNSKSISMIHKQLTTYLKINYGFILIGYYKSHGVGNRKIIWVDKHFLCIKKGINVRIFLDFHSK